MLYSSDHSYWVNNIQRWIMDEKRKIEWMKGNLLSSWPSDWIEWSGHISRPLMPDFSHVRLRKSFLWEKWGRYLGWRWLSVGIQHHFSEPFSLLLSYTHMTVRLIECLCGGTWFTELKDYFYSTCTLFTFTSKSK